MSRWPSWWSWSHRCPCCYPLSSLSCCYPVSSVSCWYWGPLCWSNPGRQRPGCPMSYRRTPLAKRRHPSTPPTEPNAWTEWPWSYVQFSISFAPTCDLHARWSSDPERPVDGQRRVVAICRRKPTLSLCREKQTLREVRNDAVYIIFPTAGSFPVDVKPS
jgi:hypothetical protein